MMGLVGEGFSFTFTFPNDGGRLTILCLFSVMIPISFTISVLFSWITGLLDIFYVLCLLCLLAC